MKIVGEETNVYLTVLPIANVDYVYDLYLKRVKKRYKGSKIEYFNCFMVAEKSLTNFPEWPEILKVKKDVNGLDDQPAASQNIRRSGYSGKDYTRLVQENLSEAKRERLRNREDDFTHN